MKTYVLTFAKHFMKGHPREGEPTHFRRNIMKAKKIHTIRSNYEYWMPRIDNVVSGKARLSLREWIGIPYRSKQREFWEITSVHNPGYQRLSIDEKGRVFVDMEMKTSGQHIARNDGLTEDEFVEWFDIPYRGIIIHFTDFRY